MKEHLQFTPLYPNALVILTILGLALIGFTVVVPTTLHSMAFDFTVPFSMACASLALVFAKRSAGKDLISFNAIYLVTLAIAPVAVLALVIDIGTLVKANDPTQLFGTFGIGLIAAIITVASAFANATKD